MGHFSAGLEHWRHGRFKFFLVNPPLVRAIATAPIAITRPELDPAAYPFPYGPGKRPEFATGALLARQLGTEYFRLVAIARWMCIPFSLLAALICYKWASELFGYTSGVIALVLSTFSPTMLAFGHLITPDMGAAATGVAAFYFFRKWLRQATLRNAIIAGIALGVAELAKMTWIILFLLWPLLWLLYFAAAVHAHEGRKWFRDGAQLLAICCLALWIINFGYGFEGSFSRLGDYRFVSITLGGTERQAVGSDDDLPIGNRFAHTWLGHIPIALPDSYLMGIDLQKSEFERKQWSYLLGQWRLGGWWYYYLFAMLIKEPIGTWILALLATGIAAYSKVYRTQTAEELLLLLPAVTIIAFVSSQTGFNHHLRYVLPAFPFIFIMISRTGRCIDLRLPILGSLVALSVFYSVMSSVAVIPHSLSFYNEFAGGPIRGNQMLANSNSDWGQDLLYLKKWQKAHPEARPLYLGYDLPLVNPSSLGIEWRELPRRELMAPIHGMRMFKFDLKPGWYVVSVNKLHEREHRFDYFNDLRPVDWVGYTMPVYHITLGDAHRLGQEYGSR